VGARSTELQVKFFFKYTVFPYQRATQQLEVYKIIYYGTCMIHVISYYPRKLLRLLLVCKIEDDTYAIHKLINHIFCSVFSVLNVT
jgi:hypothetical protein